MKKFFYALIFFLFLALIAWQFHLFFGEKICGVCDTAKNDKAIEQRDAPVQQLTNFKITNLNGDVLFQFPENFSVNASNDEVKIPHSMSSIKDSIFNFLNKNQDKELVISANYLESEGESKGLNRANFLKNFLTKGSGINPNKILPKAVMSDYSYDESNNYSGGISMLFQNTSEESKIQIEKSITEKLLYADFGTTDFKPDRTLQSYAFELKEYLLNNPEKNVTISGHTDNVGDATANKELGLKRAQNVADYLEKQGVDKIKIIVNSFGEEQPIASNETAEGQAQNRRISISVK